MLNMAINSLPTRYLGNMLLPSDLLYRLNCIPYIVGNFEEENLHEFCDFASTRC